MSHDGNTAFNQAKPTRAGSFFLPARTKLIIHKTNSGTMNIPDRMVKLIIVTPRLMATCFFLKKKNKKSYTIALSVVGSSTLSSEWIGGKNEEGEKNDEGE